jgi:hypothetical protein
VTLGGRLVTQVSDASQSARPPLVIAFYVPTHVLTYSATHVLTHLLAHSLTNLFTAAQDLRDEAKQNGGHANNKHHFSALHLARERSYQRFNLNGAERPGRSPML